MTFAARFRSDRVDTQCLDALLVALCVESFATEPEEVVLDLDATDIPLRGDQEERFFHGYYREYCYMPLPFIVGRHPVLVRRRSAARDAAAGDLRATRPPRLVLSVSRSGPVPPRLEP